MDYDFSGWATRANIKCSDGRTILKDAFKGNDGLTVPLVWNHQHTEVDNVLGHALLENRDDGVYTYCKFNDTEAGQNAKTLVEHGDITHLSIYANQLKQDSKGGVIHGAIREVSLVLAGANPGACIDSVIKHDEESEEEAVIYTEENISIYHADDNPEEDKESEKKDTSKEKTVAEVLNTLNEEQKNVVFGMIGSVLDSNESDEENENSKGGKEEMKHNLFDKEEQNSVNVLSHSDMSEILKTAKSNSVGSLRDAISIYVEKNDNLKHSFESIDALFPDYRDVQPGAPELVTRDQDWVNVVMNGVTKSPFSRIRTRQADATGNDLRGLGYQKTKQKKLEGNIKLLKRTTDPQTVYRKDALHRDDIIDITDFDVVDYQFAVMKQNLNEEIARAILIGDGRDDGSDDKISEDHIRSIWHDDDLYAIHYDVDLTTAKNELQGTNTSANFGDNYIYAEAVVTAALYSREKYKGSGNLDFYCTPHLLNVMLLARDLNGRRIYESKTDLAAALNVKAIHTVEQFEGLIRKDDDQNQHKLLGIFVNLKDYNVGATKGGEITKFSDFDIDFNQEKYLIETRLSGALTRVYSAIVLEEPIS